jgi:hypothetical protein
MSIEKLMNKIYENIISGIGEKSGVFFFFLAASSFSFSLSFYLIGNPNPHIPPNHFYSPKKYKNSPLQSKQSTFK